MADWMQDQSDADRKLLERLKALRDDARDAYNAEMRRQKAKYEQRRRRAKPDDGPRVQTIRKGK